ncbi:hypothetical protein [uncultured Peptoniphilus sp.]|uniref:hypothetical protein n=1 Tax=uncultured Peptoniphilus sp. TaxID=254354 RepID=UPI0025863992|nr:hypothetical protein [uncultured Peptoniphilus sp.]MDU6783018.1 hypothetical protein [Peptoniphilus harei]
MIKNYEQKITNINDRMSKRDEFNKGNIIYNCGMIGGLEKFAFVLKEFSIIKGLLKDFSKSVDKLFFKIMLNLLKNYKKYKNIHYNFYDVIGGLSGDSYYFLDNNFERKGIYEI